MTFDLLEMDQETFDMMWSLSEPGGAAEKCFLRLSQTEYYPAEMPGRHELENMPNVSSTVTDGLASVVRLHRT
jgi:D-amino-acid oxidase